MNFDESYEVKCEKKFDQWVRKNLPKNLKSVLDKKLEYFSENPGHPSLNTKPYHVSEKTKKQLGVDDVYEFYVNRKQYRCLVYVIHSSKELIIAHIGTHDQLRNFSKG